MEVKVLNHPYIQAVLTQLRDFRTGQIDFRKSLVRLGRAFGLEIIKEFPFEEVSVKTPLGTEAKGLKIRGASNVVIVTVLRAAWPMTEGLIKVFPQARQGIISARRVEEKGMSPNGTFEVDITYVKLPNIREEDTVIVVDPMIATGSTMKAVLKEVVKAGKAKKYIIASAITTPIAVARLSRVSEELGINLTMYTASIDPEIDEKGYIVPGLGDAGDRAFGSQEGP